MTDNFYNRLLALYDSAEIIDYIEGLERKVDWQEKELIELEQVSKKYKDQANYYCKLYLDTFNQLKKCRGMIQFLQNEYDKVAGGYR